jgi:hypothetical protein
MIFLLDLQISSLQFKVIYPGTIRMFSYLKTMFAGSELYCLIWGLFLLILGNFLWGISFFTFIDISCCIHYFQTRFNSTDQDIFYVFSWVLSASLISCHTIDYQTAVLIFLCPNILIS